MSRWPMCAVSAIALGLCAPSSARAHGPVHDDIQALSAQIAGSPEDASLRLARGRMYLAQAHARRAIADFRRSLELDPTLTAAYYFLARAELAAHQFRAAEAHARTFVERLADDNRGGLVRGNRLLGDVLAARGKLEAAVARYRLAVDMADTPSPDDVMTLADALAQAGRGDRAVRALDAGVAALGPVVALERRALELELGAGRTDAALRRVDRLIAASSHPAAWLLELARVHVTRGDSVGARAAATRGLGIVERMPVPRRRAPAVRELERSLRGIIAAAAD